VVSSTIVLVLVLVLVLEILGLGLVFFGLQNHAERSRFSKDEDEDEHGLSDEAAADCALFFPGWRSRNHGQPRRRLGEGGSAYSA
jgi:hypothetical protein